MSGIKLAAGRVRPMADIERRNQKLIVKSLMPFHFPVSGSSSTLSSALPYTAGAFGFSICNGFPPRAARARTPSVFSFFSGGGVAAGRGFRWTLAVNVFFCGCGDCAKVTLAKTTNIPNITSFFITVFPVKVGSCRLDSSGAELSRQMDYLEKARRVLDLEIRELERLRQRLGDDFSRAVGLIKDAVDARGKVVVLGVGKSGHIGGKIASTLTSTGSPAVVLDSLNALHGDLGMVADGDVILALSSSGETEELVRILPAIARFQVKIIAICGDADSTLAKNAHVVLDVNVEQEACPLNLAPTSSTTAMLALGDAIAMVLLEARGFDKKDFAKFHPSGKIGRSLLMRVHQVMRPRESMAVVPPTATVRDVLKAMTSVRAGAAVVAGEDRQLLGIFTHGDFARHFQSDPKIGERLVADLMTLNPVTVHKDKLAVEVLNLLESHRIDDLVVVDDDKAPVGVVDSQDLTRLKLL